MRRFLILSLLFLVFLLSSCYVNNIALNSVTFTDRGYVSGSGSEHIISISAGSSKYSSIYYTLDGTEPTKNSLLYSPEEQRCNDGNWYSGIIISEGVTIKAAAFIKSSGARSLISEFTVTGKDEVKEEKKEEKKEEPQPASDAPLISRDVHISNNEKCIVSIASVDSSYEIYYTTDGSDPRTDGTLYEPLSLTNDRGESVKGILVEYGVTVKAVAKKGDVCTSVSEKLLSLSYVRVNLSAGFSSDSKWVRSNAFDVGDYCCYKSTNEGKGDSKAVMSITFSGYETFSLYIRSDGENPYDYAIVSTLDAEEYPGNRESEYSYVTTRNSQSADKKLSSYTRVEFTAEKDGQHQIYVVYAKDEFVDSGSDAAYVLLSSDYFD